MGASSEVRWSRGGGCREQPPRATWLSRWAEMAGFRDSNKTTGACDTWIDDFWAEKRVGDDFWRTLEQPPNECVVQSGAKAVSQACRELTPLPTAPVLQTALQTTTPHRPRTAHGETRSHGCSLRSSAPIRDYDWRTVTSQLHPQRPVDARRRCSQSALPRSPSSVRSRTAERGPAAALTHGTR